MGFSFYTADSTLELTQAIREFQELIHDLNQAGLCTQVRHGHGNSLLVCIKVPRDLLGNMIHKSRYSFLSPLFPVICELMKTE